MRLRWFQFRLRTLLAFLVLLCIALGAWSLYWTYFGPYVEADPVVAGQPIRVRGRFMDFFGDDSIVYVVQITKPMPDGRRLIYQSRGGQAARRGLWSYDFEADLRPIEKSGTFKLEVRPLTRAVRATPKGKPRPGIVSGEIILLPPTGDQAEN